TGWATVALLRRRSSRSVLQYGLVAILAGSTALVVAVEAGWSLWAVLPALFVAIACVGFVFPTTTGLALLGRARDAGSASALLGTAQFLAGSAAGPLVTLGGP